MRYQAVLGPLDVLRGTRVCECCGSCGWYGCTGRCGFAVGLLVWSDANECGLAGVVLESCRGRRAVDPRTAAIRSQADDRPLPSVWRGAASNLIASKPPVRPSSILDALSEIAFAPPSDRSPALANGADAPLEPRPTLASPPPNRAPCQDAAQGTGAGRTVAGLVLRSRRRRWPRHGTSTVSPGPSKPLVAGGDAAGPSACCSDGPRPPRRLSAPAALSAWPPLAVVSGRPLLRGLAYLSCCLLGGADQVRLGRLELRVHGVALLDLVEEREKSRVSQIFLIPPGNTSNNPLSASSLSHLPGSARHEHVLADARSRYSALDQVVLAHLDIDTQLEEEDGADPDDTAAPRIGETSVRL